MLSNIDYILAASVACHSLWLCVLYCINTSFIVLCTADCFKYYRIFFFV